MTTPVPITVAKGDGIGPEIMDATLKIIQAAGAALDIDEIEIGEQVFKQGFSAGIKPEAWDSLRRTKVFLKSPITTPQGGGYKSLNVTVRKTLGLFVNLRPCTAYAPYVKTLHPDLDLVIVRENEEDLYAGIEHRQTTDVTQCLKLISRPGSERLLRYAFEYAQAQGRKKVTCFSKDNIMKLTDGLFHSVFDEVSAEYKDVETDHMIIDIGAARLADTPADLDVLVTSNLYGDILSDIAAQIAGSVGLGGSANIGEHCAMFEAIHGSAPDIAGKGIANPSGLLQGAVLMLTHIGQADVAQNVQNAWLKTLEDGIHTGDLKTEGYTKQVVGTQDFCAAVLERLGQKPSTLKPVTYRDGVKDAVKNAIAKSKPRANLKKELVGVDVFVEKADLSPDGVAEMLNSAKPEGLELKMISNRGVKVWPDGLPETFCTDHWRCRFQAPGETVIAHKDIVALLDAFAGKGIDFIKMEQLYLFDGKPGFSLGQGQ